MKPVGGELEVIVRAATEFGLDEREISAALIELCTRASTASIDLVDELSEALASRIMEHERNVAAAPGRVPGG